MANAGGSDAELIRIEGLEVRFPNLVMIQEPVTHIEVVAFSKIPNHKITGWDDLKPFSLAYLDGMILVEEAVQGFRAQGCRTMNKALELVANDRYDLALLPRIDGLGYLKESDINSIVPLEPPLAKRPLYHYIHSKHQHLAKPLESALKAMKASGEWQQLREQFIAELVGS